MINPEKYSRAPLTDRYCSAQCLKPVPANTVLEWSVSLPQHTRSLIFRTALAFAFLSPSSASWAEQLMQINRDLQDGASSGVELIADPGFKAGFSATPACNSPTAKACAENTRYNLKSPAFPDMADVKPVWELRQWGSRSTLGKDAVAYEDGFAWMTPDKRLAIHPDGRVEMAVNGESEFQGQYRNGQPASPSLIAGQSISGPGPYYRDTGSIDEMTRLEFNLDFRLEYENQNKKRGYDAGRNAVIFPINFTVQNLNTKSSGYGQFVWLQINPYDDRREVPVSKKDQEMTDVGTGMSIYFVPTASLTRGNTHSGEWVNLHGDILPYAQRSVEVAFRKGILKSNDLSDYKIGGVNIGYELTGLNITTMEFKNLSLKMFKD